MLSSQLEVVTKRFDGEPYHVLSTYLITLINTTTIVVFLPIVNHTILPFFYAFSVSLRVRLGIGQVFNVLAVLIAVLLQGVAEENKDITSTIKLLLLFLPAIILSIGESLTFVTGKALYIVACSDFTVIIFYLIKGWSSSMPKHRSL